MSLTTNYFASGRIPFEAAVMRSTSTDVWLVERSSTTCTTMRLSGPKPTKYQRAKRRVRGGIKWKRSTNPLRSYSMRQPPYATQSKPIIEAIEAR